MYHRNICNLDESYCERCNTTTQTLEHIFCTCPIAGSIWDCIGVAVSEDHYKRPWLLEAEAQLPRQVALDVFLVILWQIWKARNALIFDHRNSTSRDVLRCVVADLGAWSCRYKTLESSLLRWQEFLLHRPSPPLYPLPWYGRMNLYWIMSINT
ncbi:hypothetical protein HU200_050046 [Digitaria exilis]|uniref:Reverse transcriptase zinc-binding domain-containing protein n=1 Tax=Digitaria exilis TaxID=1010633 RepID=A0A835EBJ0_9POAL|nr:hypothetical protein HU200_050046 [Digitaria exilis]